MASKRIFLLFSILILISASIYAQGDYLELGKSGSQLGLQFVYSKGAYKFYHSYGCNFSGGVSYYGMVDGGFSFGMTGVDRYASSENAFIVAPSLTVYPLKQGMGGLPFSTALGASLQIANYVGDIAGLSEISYNFGGWLLSNINIVESFTVQPNIGVTYQHPKDVWDNKINSLNLGLSMFLKFAKKHKTLRFDFTYANAEEFKSYGFQLGLIFESHKDKVDERWDW